MMLQWLTQIPHLDAYGNPLYFVYLIMALVPIFIGLFFNKRVPVYETIVSLFFLVSMLVGKMPEPSWHYFQQVIALLIYIVWQTAVVFGYKQYRAKHDANSVFYAAVVLAILPLLIVKISPVLHWRASLIGFLGISYLTFKSVGMVMEMRDGVLTSFSLWQFLRFLVFLPTFTSGPIDRFRRFNQDYETIPDREKLLDLLEKAVWYLMLGFLYKFIIAGQFETWYHQLSREALSRGGLFNLPTFGLMYVYGFYLFFDFAGYSLFAMAMSHLMGIEVPRNFDQPFKSRDVKEFWNRWHMSLSFWFRDFVFMRLVKVMVKNKTFKNRNVTSSVAYLLNMLLMGFWHGVAWYYIAYGLFHGICLVVNDAWLRKKKKINKTRKSQGLPALPDNVWTKVTGIAITFHVVMFSFLIFSGFLDKLWFR